MRKADKIQKCGHFNHVVRHHMSRCLCGKVKISPETNWLQIWADITGKRMDKITNTILRRGRREV